MKSLKKYTLVMMCLVPLLFGGCDENGNFLIFSIEEDKNLGAQMDAQIESDPVNYPILSRTEYPEAYAYLDGMVNEILQNGDVTYRDEFVWEVHIINQDVLNAFVTPGGYIYVYSGLIQYLERADDLAGVIGHEIAHADQRHGSKQMQKQYGVALLLSIALGDDATALESIVADVASGLASLAFSRADENEADAFSVRYLANTQYACNGAATFFERLTDEGLAGAVPEFLSTHPSPVNRVADINAEAGAIGCSVTASLDSPSGSCAADTEYDCFRFDYLPDL